jgi:hypothetical protein
METPGITDHLKEPDTEASTEEATIIAVVSETALEPITSAGRVAIPKTAVDPRGLNLHGASVSMSRIGPYAGDAKLFVANLPFKVSCKTTMDLTSSTG